MSKKSRKTIPKKQALPVEPLEFTDLAYEKINDEYSYGMFGPFKLIIDEDGYFNVSKLCLDATKKFGIRKNFYDWKRLKGTKSILNQVKNVCAVITVDELIHERPNLSNELKGTYVHPKLVSAIAIWASPKFYIMVNEIVSNFFINRMIEEKEEIISKQNNIIKKKDNAIDKLNKTVMRIEEKADKLLKENEKIQEKLDNLNDSNNRILIKFYKMQSIANKKAETHVRLTGFHKDEYILVILETNLLLQNMPKSKFIGDYYIMRLMNKSLQTQMSKFKKRHPYMRIIEIIPTVSNSMNIWHHMKNNYTRGNEKMITILSQNKSANYFNICNNYEIDDILTSIKEEYGNRFEDIELSDSEDSDEE